MNIGDVVRRLQVLEDIESIKKLKARYSDACDDCYNPALLEGMFTDDAVWDGGAHFGRHVGRGEIRKFFAEVSGNIVFAMHYAIAPDIEIHGDAAEARWYLWMLATTVDNRGGWYSGKYRDKYEKIGDVWLFREVKVELSFATRYEDGWHKAPFSMMEEVSSQ